MSRFVFLSLGVVSLGLAFLGVALPLVPTTPFALLSAFCFAKSSPRFHNYLITHPILGAYISNYYSGTMSRPHKIKTLVLLWISILFSIYLIGKLIPAIILPIIASGVSIHIARLSPPTVAATDSNLRDAESPKPADTETTCVDACYLEDGEVNPAGQSQESA